MILFDARSSSSRSSTAPVQELRRSTMKNSFTVNKTETTNKIVFVSFDCNVDTNKLHVRVGTCFDREGLTIARKSCNKSRIENTRLDNAFNISEASKGTWFGSHSGTRFWTLTGFAIWTLKVCSSFCLTVRFHLPRPILYSSNLRVRGSISGTVHAISLEIGLWLHSHHRVP